MDGIDWDNLPGEPAYDAWDAYSLSKFADVAFTYSLARNLVGTSVTANCLHPGVVDTKLLPVRSSGIATITPEEGAQTSIWLARSPDVAGISGRYFDNRRLYLFFRPLYDRGVQERLWKMAEALTGMGRVGCNPVGIRLHYPRAVISVSSRTCVCTKRYISSRALPRYCHVTVVRGVK